MTSYIAVLIPRDVPPSMVGHVAFLSPREPNDPQPPSSPLGDVSVKTKRDRKVIKADRCSYPNVL